MRIIAGIHKGRRIQLPKENRQIRPTSDFAREAIFNLLTHGKFASRNLIEGARVLDVFCGSGALGLEALSRGAVYVTFIDHSREAMDIVRHNIEHFGEGVKVKLLLLDATQLPVNQATAYDIALLDAPYHQKLLTPALQKLAQGGWLQNGAFVLIEHDEREKVDIPEHYTSVDTRRYGRANIHVLQYH